MTNLQIPIYRGKQLDGEGWVEGTLDKIEEYFWITTKLERLNQRVDPLTLAIHFPDMIDSEGTKIFASLNKNGEGGDKLVKIEDDLITYNIAYKNRKIEIYEDYNGIIYTEEDVETKHFKIIGKQK